MEQKNHKLRGWKKAKILARDDAKPDAEIYGTEQNQSSPPPPTEMDVMACDNCGEKNAKFRPLMNENGEFLCDNCYQSMFPATSMCDPAMKKHFKKKPNSYIQRKKGILEESMKIFASREDKKGTDKFADDGSLSPRTKKRFLKEEEEECRACLDPGILRYCCNNYYCKDCYNKYRRCPGCKAHRILSGIQIEAAKRKIQRPKTTSPLVVILTFVIPLCVPLLVGIWIIVPYINDRFSPRSIWGEICDGWSPKCDMDLCIDLNQSKYLDEWSPELGFSLPPIIYEKCSSKSKTKIIGLGCRTDIELYRATNGDFGFDFCHRTSSSDRNMFPDQAVAFVDDFANNRQFDYDSNGHGSIGWSKIVNGNRSNICSATPEFGRQATLTDRLLFSGTEGDSRGNALVFSGDIERYAETSDFDLRNGGTIGFYLKLAPIARSENETECKTAYQGEVFFMASIDHGLSWTKLKEFTIWEYRRSFYSRFECKLPSYLWGDSVRFRWEQAHFDPNGDFWAIDKVTIFNLLPFKWSESAEYQIMKKRRHSFIQKIQCCFETDYCENSPDALSKMNETCPWLSTHYDLGLASMLNSTDIFMFIVCVFALLKTAFRFGYDLIDLYVKKYAISSVSFVKTSDQEVENVDDEIESSMPYRKRDYFKCRSSSSWRVVVAVLAVSPITASSLILFALWAQKSEFTTKEEGIKLLEMNPIQLLSLAIAVIMDFGAFLEIWRDYFFLWPMKPPSVYIDAKSDEIHLCIRSKNLDSISLLDVKDFTYFTAKYNSMICGLSLFGALPFLSVCTILKLIWLPYKASRGLLQPIYILALARVCLGSGLFVKAHLAVKQCLKLTDLARDELGLSLINVRTLAYVLAMSSCCAISSYIGYVLFSSERSSGGSFFLLLGAFFGSLVGSLAGMLHDAPISPKFILTAWPEGGYIFHCQRRERKKKFQAESLMIFVEETSTFLRFLQGEGHNQLDDEKEKT